MEKLFQGPKLLLCDCRDAVSNKIKTANFKILERQQVAFEEINGYLGEHCILKITIERNSKPETLTFFIKFPPQVQSQLNFLTEINGIFKEESFYTRYLSLLKKLDVNILDKSIPECYHVSNGTFFFENLKGQNFTTLPSRTPLELDYVRAALKTFAKLHASGLILEEKMQVPLSDSFEVELKESFYLGTDSTECAMKSCKLGIGALIDITHQDHMGIPKDVFKDKALEGCDLQKVFTKPSKKFRNTLCHADPWTKNFLFRKDNDGSLNCVIVDFQTYRYGPPGQDVVAFIHLVTSKEMRELHYEELLDFYYQELSENLEFYGFEDLVTRHEFLDSCVYFKHFALTQTLTHFQVVILRDDIAQELFEDPENTKFVLFENKYEFMKMVCQSDEVFLKRNLDAIIDLREFFEIEMTKEITFIL